MSESSSCGRASTNRARNTNVCNSAPGTRLLCGNDTAGRGMLTSSATVVETGTVSTFAASSSAQIFTGQRSTPQRDWAASAAGVRHSAPSRVHARTHRGRRALIERHIPNLTARAATRSPSSAYVRLLPTPSRAYAMGMPVQETEWTAEMVRALPDDGRRYEVLDGE